MLTSSSLDAFLTQLFGSIFFFFNDTATTEIYTLSLHDALPILHDRRPIPDRRHAGAFRVGVREGQRARAVCQPGAAVAEAGREARAASAGVAGGQGERSGPEVAGSRASRILDVRPGQGGRSIAIAVVSTAFFFGLLTLVVVTSPGWAEVRQAFFSGEQFRESFPDILDAFWLNVKIFLIAETVILVTALLIAVLRSLPGPVFFPLRVLGIAYTDLFRGIPTILVIYILGFGAPALQLHGLPTSPFFWGVVSLVLVYSAYVAEVYRAGIESVHPSQEAAARSLGLSRFQS